MGGRGGRGRGRGGRGGVSLIGRGGSPATVAAVGSTANVPAEHIQTVGVRRKAHGTAGRAVKVYTNHFGVDIPGEIIYHYDGAPLPPLIQLEAVAEHTSSLAAALSRSWYVILRAVASVDLLTLSQVMNQNSEQTLPIRANMDIIRRLQEQIAPQVFTPRCVYDGRKNMFSIRRLPFPDGKETVGVTL